MMKHTWRLLGILLAAGLGLQTVAARENLRVLTSQEDLRDLLQEAQWLLLPQEFPVEADMGAFFFLPDSLASEDFLSAFAVDVDGETPVFIFEDADTRETVFVDAEGNRVEALAPAADYTPLWALDLLAPEELPEDVLPEDFDPARVSLALKLLPVFSLAEQQANAAVMAERRALLRNRILLRVRNQTRMRRNAMGGHAFSMAAVQAARNASASRLGAGQRSGMGVSIFYAYDADDRLLDTAIGATGAGATNILSSAGNVAYQEERSAQ